MDGARWSGRSPPARPRPESSRDRIGLPAPARRNRTKLTGPLTSRLTDVIASALASVTLPSAVTRSRRRSRTPASASRPSRVGRRPRRPGTSPRSRPRVAPRPDVPGRPPSPPTVATSADQSEKFVDLTPAVGTHQQQITGPGGQSGAGQERHVGGGNGRARSSPKRQRMKGTRRRPLDSGQRSGTVGKWIVVRLVTLALTIATQTRSRSWSSPVRRSIRGGLAGVGVPAREFAAELMGQRVDRPRHPGRLAGGPVGVAARARSIGRQFVVRPMLSGGSTSPASVGFAVARRLPGGWPTVAAAVPVIRRART